MKAVVFEGPHRLLVSDRALRPMASDEVLLRVNACGVCGTDVHIFEGNSRSTAPVILGHEYWGVVEDIGTGVGNVAIGDTVAVDPNVSCGQCPYCVRGLVHLCEHLKAYGVDLDGGMAERSIVRVSQVHRLPPGMTPETSTFIEPVSCCIHGMDKGNVRKGDTVVFLGGGTIGLLLLQLAISRGAGRTIVVEPGEMKRTLARRLGADVVLNPEKDNAAQAVFDLTGIGADVVFECAGKIETSRQSLDLARRGGTVVLFGVCPMGQTIDVEPNAVYFKELTITGSYINPHTFERAIEMLGQKKVKIEAFPLGRFPLDAVHDALAGLGKGETIKNVILPIL